MKEPPPPLTPSRAPPDVPTTSSQFADRPGEFFTSKVPSLRFSNIVTLPCNWTSNRMYLDCPDASRIVDEQPARDFDLFILSSRPFYCFRFSFLSPWWGRPSLPASTSVFCSPGSLPPGSFPLATTLSASRFLRTDCSGLYKRWKCFSFPSPSFFFSRLAVGFFCLACGITQTFCFFVFSSALRLPNVLA